MPLLFQHRLVLQLRSLTAELLLVASLAALAAGYGAEPFGIPVAEAAPGINRAIHYQGKMRLSSGTAVADGSYNVRFKIFTAATGGVPAWTETWNSSTSQVSMTGGLFSVALGTHVTMTGSIDFNTDNLYLQVEFDPGNDGTYEEVFSPRRRFAAVPYAHNANTLDGYDSYQFLRRDTAQALSGALTIQNTGTSLIAKGAVSGATLFASSGLSTSGSFVAKGAVTFKNYVSCAVITTDGNGNLGCSSTAGLSQPATDARYVNTSGDTMTGGLLIVSGSSSAVIDTGLLLEIAGTASGRTIHAQDSLRSSGSLIVDGASIVFGNAAFASCTALETNSAGALVCGSDDSGTTPSTFGSGNVLSISDRRYVSTSGDTMTGGLLIVSGSSSATIDAGLLLEIAGTASGRTIHAQDSLRSSGSLVVEGSVTLAGVPSCTALQTSFNGALSCNNALYLATSTGSLETRFNSLYLRSSTGSLESRFNSLYFRSSTGALQSAFDRRYVSTSGDTMTGGLLIVSGSSSATIDAGLLLEIAGTASGRTIHAQDSLRSSGSLIVDGASIVFGNAAFVSCGALETNSNGALVCGTDDGGAGISEGVEGRYVNASGDTMTGGLLIVSTAHNPGTIEAGLLLEIGGTASGRHLHAQDRLSSSGSLSVEGALNIDHSTLVVDPVTDRVGVNTVSPDAALDIQDGMLRFSDAVDGSIWEQTYDDALNYFYIDEVGAARHFKIAAGGLVSIGGGSASIANDATLEVFGSMSGRLVHADTLLTSSGGLAVDGSSIVFGHSTFTNCSALETANGVVTCGTDDAGAGGSLYTSTGSLRAAFDSRYVNTSGDTMTGGLLIVSGSSSATIDAGLLLEIAGTMSGRTIFAHDSLASSGSLVVRTGVTFKNLASCAVITTSAAGVLSCGTTFSTSTGSLQAGFDRRYVQVQGDTMTGGLLLNLGGSATASIDTGLALEIIGTASGRILQAQDQLRSSGTLVVRGGVTFRSLTSCLGLQTDSNGALSCASGGGITQSAADGRYVNISGDAMTGALSIKKLSGTSTGDILVVDTTGLVYDASAKQVGIGTDAPTSSLHIIAASPEFRLATSNGTSLRVARNSANTVSVSNQVAAASYALTFDGLNDYIDSVNTGPASMPITLAMWVRPDGANPIGIYDTSPGNANVLRQASAGTVEWWNNDPSVSMGLTGSVWQHLIVEYRHTGSARVIRVYRNGAFVAMGTGSSTTTFSWTDLQFGRINNGGGGYYSGLIDDIRVYSGLLSGTDISDLYNGGSGTSNSVGSNLFLWYPLDEGAGSTLTDASGNGRNATIGGSAVWTSGAITGTTQDVAFITNQEDGETSLGLTKLGSSGGTTHVQGRTVRMLTGGGVERMRITAEGLMGIGTTVPETRLEIIGTASGRVLHAQDRLASSGTLVAQGGVTFKSLTSCASLQTSSNGALSCGSSISQTAADSRYVNTSGDTMTGGLLIVSGSSSATIDAGLLLEIAGTMSGRTIHAQSVLRSSGSLVVEGNANIDAGTLMVDSANNRVGIGTASPQGPMHVVAGSERMLIEVNDANGLSPLNLWNSNASTAAGAGMLFTTGASHTSGFIGGVVSTRTDANNAITAFRVLSNGTFSSGDASATTVFYLQGTSTQTNIIANGFMGINSASPTERLEIAGTASGRVLHAQDRLASSGTLVAQGGVTFKSLTSCASLQTSSNGALSCGSSISQTAADSRYVNTSGDTMTGGLLIVSGSSSATIDAGLLLEIAGTMSGRTIHAQDMLRSSGSLLVESGAIIDNTTFVVDGINNRVGIGTAAPATSLHVNTSQANDGISVRNGIRLIATLRRNGSTDNGQLYIEDSGGNGAINLIAGTNSYIRAGNLAIGASVTAETTLEILGTASGRVLHAQDRLASSGTLVVRGGVTFKNITSCTALQTDSAGALSCGVGGSGISQTAADSRYVNTSGDTMTGGLLIVSGSSSATIDAGLLLEIAGTMSGRTIHAQDMLRSSGSLVIEGGARIDDTTLTVDATNNRVGVGTAAPGYSLDVRGQTRIAAAGTGYVTPYDFSVQSNTVDTWFEILNYGGADKGAFFGITGDEFQLWNYQAGAITFFTAITPTSGAERMRIAPNGNVGIGITDPEALLEVGGSLSGSLLTISELKSCASLQTNLNGHFSCGSGGSGISQTAADSRYVNTSGDTMTGGLLIQSAGTPGTIDAGLLLEVAGTMSGRRLHVQNLLSGSGGLSIEGTSRFAGHLLPDATNAYDLGSSALRWRDLYLSGSSLHIGSAALEGRIGYRGAGSEGLTFNASGSHIQMFLSSGGMLGVGTTLPTEMLHIQSASSRDAAIRLNIGPPETSFGPNSASTGADDASAGTIAWSDTGNVTASDDSYATAFGISGTTHYLTATNLGFNIPANATILGIVAEVEKKKFTGSVQDTAVRIVKGGAIGSSDKSIAGEWQSSDAYSTYGSSTDLWGESWTASNINASNFGIALSATFISGQAHVDHVRITVYYGVAGWILGGDASDSSKFKLSRGFGLGTNDLLTLSTTGSLLLGTGSTVLTSSNVPRGSLVLSNGAVCIDNGGDNCDDSARTPGTIYAVTTSVQAMDVAEQYPTRDASLMPGDIAALDPVNPVFVRKATGESGERIIGIVSTEPGILLGGFGQQLYALERQVPIALNGRVPLKVTASGGAIIVGDALSVWSNAGVAGKAQPGDQVVGYALEPFSGTGTGLIQTFVNIMSMDEPGLDTLSELRIDNETSSGSQTLFSVISDVGHDENTVFKVTGSGNVTADGTFMGGGADYAEYFYSSAQNLLQGELVCIDVTRASTVTRCDREGDANVIGVVSSESQAAFIGNRFEGADGLPVPGTALVGLLGQLKTKVSIEGGEIRIGDSLTPASLPGFARKAKAGEPTVGVALEGLTGGEGTTGAIDILIARRNGSLTAEAVEDKVMESIKAMQIEDEVQIMVSDAVSALSESGALLDPISEEVGRQMEALELHGTLQSLQSQIDELKRIFGSGSSAATPAADAVLLTELTLRITALENRPGTTVTASGSDLIASTLSVDSTLSVGTDARIAGDLYLDGALRVSDLFVPGMMTVDGALRAQELEIASGAVIHGPVILHSRLELASGSTIAFGTGTTLELSQLVVRDALMVLGDITINGLATFLGDVEIKGTLSVSSRQAGFVTIPKGATGATVTYEQAFDAEPVVNATPNGRTGAEWWVDRATASGFIISVSVPVMHDVRFSWFAVGLVSSSGATVRSSSSSSSVAISFPVDQFGVPLSSNAAWNACIRNQTILDAEGQPLSCTRYHDGNVWQHPDLGIEFTWNDSVTPALLLLPEGYAPVSQQIDAADTALPEPSVESPSQEEYSSFGSSSSAEAAQASSAPVESAQPAPLVEAVPDADTPVMPDPVVEEAAPALDEIATDETASTEAPATMENGETGEAPIPPEIPIE